MPTLSDAPVARMPRSRSSYYSQDGRLPMYDRYICTHTYTPRLERVLCLESDGVIVLL